MLLIFTHHLALAVVSCDELRPESLRSVVGQGYIDVLWDDVLPSANPYTSDAIMGYRVYKWSAGVEPLFFFTTQPRYRDTQVATGIRYNYSVTVVNQDGVEGCGSAGTSATYVDTAIRTYTDGAKKKSVPFSKPPTCAAVGDINKDGKPDLVLGIPELNAVKIYYDCNVNALPGTTLTGESGGDGFGSSVALADLNQDGYADLIVGAPLADVGKSANSVPDAGKVYVYAGKRSLSSKPSLIVEGKPSCTSDGAPCTNGEHLGSALAGVRDVDGDGTPDVAIGAPAGGLDRTGRIVILRGGTPLAERVLDVPGREGMKCTGRSLSLAGDVDGDGLHDILVGAGNCEGGEPSTGEVRLLLGGSTPALSDLAFTGAGGNGAMGAGLDFNGDGYSDIAVGSSTESQIDLYFGGPLLDASPDIVFPASRGYVGSLGDVNRDGRTDLALGCLMVHYGNSRGENVPDVFIDQGAQAVLGTGDIDGDGLEEMLSYASGSVRAHSLAYFSSLPHIEVTSHLDYARTSSGCLTIAGRVHGAVSRLTVRGEPAESTPDGYFSKDLSPVWPNLNALRPGVNAIEILAETPDGRVGKKIVHIEYTPPPLGIEITTPAPGSVLYSNTFTVVGRVSDPSALVWVDGWKPVQVVDGAFEATVSRSSAGEAHIRVLAGDASCNFVEKWIRVVLEIPAPTVVLTADPITIRPGQTTTLSWTSSNATVCSVDNGVGGVPLSGSVTVSPSETTTYTLTATGPGGMARTAAAVTVVNALPVCLNDVSATDEDVPVVIHVLANDTDPDGDALQVKETGQGLHGSASIRPDGSILYSPQANYHGSDQFTYTVTDGHGGLATATVDVTVSSLNDAPVAAHDSAATDQGRSVCVSVLANDSDPDGDSLTLSGFTPPSHGTVKDSGNGTLEYCPTASFTGEDSFTYTVSDGKGATATATVTVAVKSAVTLGIKQPVEGQRVDGGQVQVSGIVSNAAGRETGVTVNGVLAWVHEGRFVANSVPLQPGENNIQAVAVDTAGAGASDSITIDADAEQEAIEIKAVDQSGIPPFETTFRIKVSAAYQNPTLSYAGPGGVEFLNTEADEEFTVRMTIPGWYDFIVEAFDFQNYSHTQTLSLLVLDKNSLDGLLRARWNGMKGELAAGKIAGALSYFLPRSRERYGAVFNDLSERLPAIAAGMQEIEMVYSRDGRTKYRINRSHSTAAGPVTLAYYIYFAVDETGLWRLDVF
ncbi:Ig-like domain-containing protein [Desulforhabdus sp. TSK]|uniref:Ig-like domain-containing protein n=1 Tax=Desulforhabdus sp. TSK TaxID=2925014 RepID=UPI001FC898EC|nr:Ig-like domain-containing protein [Desulforhabdus sp. TSK]